MGVVTSGGSQPQDQRLDAPQNPGSGYNPRPTRRSFLAHSEISGQGQGLEGFRLRA